MKIEIDDRYFKARERIETEIRIKCRYGRLIPIYENGKIVKLEYVRTIKTIDQLESLKV
jgi:hypothetical protein